MTDAAALIHPRSPIADNPLSALKKRANGVQFSLANVGAETQSQNRIGAALGQIKPTVTPAGQGNILSTQLLGQLSR